MRTLRLSVAGTVMLALLAGHAVATAGQEETATHVTGSLACWQAGGDSTTLEDDAVGLYLFPGRCTVRMSDPRVSGIMEGDVQEACFEEAGHACMMFITSELTGPDGTWVGVAGSVHDSSLAALPTWVTMEGTGAYDGWTFVFFTPDQLDPSAVASGIIYEGPPPPWGDSLPLTPDE